MQWDVPGTKCKFRIERRKRKHSEPTSHWDGWFRYKHGCDNPCCNKQSGHPWQGSYACRTFDRQIHVELPDLNEREAIFKVHLRPIKLEKSFDIGFMAKQTPGFSGADIANVCNEFSPYSRQEEQNGCWKTGFPRCYRPHCRRTGEKNQNHFTRREENNCISWSRHATVSWLLEYASPLLKVTIIPRGRALGAAWYLPEERQLTTREQILDEMAYALGGRAAEELILVKFQPVRLMILKKLQNKHMLWFRFSGWVIKLVI